MSLLSFPSIQVLFSFKQKHVTDPKLLNGSVIVVFILPHSVPGGLT